MMEDAIEATSSALIVREGSSVSPTTFYNESPYLEPMMTDVKLLPTDYSECDFTDLVNLIGMSFQFFHVGLKLHVDFCWRLLTLVIARMLTQLMGINVCIINALWLTLLGSNPDISRKANSISFTVNQSLTLC